jgi:hypothetical protein
MCRDPGNSGTGNPGNETLLYGMGVRCKQKIKTMGWLVISCAECHAISARRRTTAHFTVVSTDLCSGYVVDKTVSCVLMHAILMTMI